MVLIDERVGDDPESDNDSVDEQQFDDDERVGDYREFDNDSMDEERFDDDEPVGDYQDFDNDSMDGQQSDGDTSEDEGDTSTKESYGSNLVDSPGGSRKLWQPIVPERFKPDSDIEYDSLDNAIKMYETYAEKAGFEVRKNTTTRFKNDKTIKIRYIVCHKNGKIPDKSVDTLDSSISGRKRRNSNFKITDCRALIKFERVNRTERFKIRDFHELHNHPLQDKEEQRHTRKARKLDFTDKEFIVRASTSNIGATKAHKLRASLKGGYQNVGPHVTDYKNYRRDMGNIIGDRDAQMIVDKMNDRKKTFAELHI